MDNIIEIKGLCKQYQDFRLDNLNLTIAPGTITGLVGANGAGKSTTLKLMLNLIRRDAGSIKIFGMDNIADEAAVKKDIGVVFDEPCFHDQLTPAHISGYMAGLYPDWDDKLFRRYLQQFSLPDSKVVKDFSRGMKMKLSIAAALSHRPKLLLLDEPTSGLDPLVRDEILDIFLEYLQAEDHAILLSSHITSDLDKIADTIALLDHGRLLFHEEKDELRDKYVLVKGGDGLLETIGRDRMVGVRKNQFGFEGLCLRENLPRMAGLETERPTIEEIMLFFTRGERK